MVGKSTPGLGSIYLVPEATVYLKVNGVPSFILMPVNVYDDPTLLVDTASVL